MQEQQDVGRRPDVGCAGIHLPCASARRDDDVIGECARDGACVVVASAVDDDDLHAARAQRLKVCQRGRNDAAFIENGDDDRESHACCLHRADR